MLLSIHDQLIREGIAKHNGTQIATEGDSFQVAFLSIVDAVSFCMVLQCRTCQRSASRFPPSAQPPARRSASQAASDALAAPPSPACPASSRPPSLVTPRNQPPQELQHKLLETPWPRAVLRLPGCEPRVTEEGETWLRGPRVRCGCHYALPGLAAVRLHALTQARHGLRFQSVNELCHAMVQSVGVKRFMGERNEKRETGVPCWCGRTLTPRARTAWRRGDGACARRWQPGQVDPRTDGSGVHSLVACMQAWCVAARTCQPLTPQRG
jgi:hypothetical protein